MEPAAHIANYNCTNFVHSLSNFKKKMQNLVKISIGKNGMFSHIWLNESASDLLCEKIKQTRTTFEFFSCFCGRSHQRFV